MHMTQTQYHIPACTVQAVREATAIIRTLLSSIHPMQAGQIARTIGVPHSQTQKLLYTLEIEGLVVCDRLDQWDIHSDGLWAALNEEQT
ncbi:MAG: helix-turn-helix domain-containing protein [Gemmatimonadetes bacterium]|nr:helix-turn-helix domain-containing protein [Gemmatimonadota bacterium]MYF79398.1 helix-turn-helix domain-containing protein [Chloroflexota bacterium]